MRTFAALLLLVVALLFPGFSQAQIVPHAVNDTVCIIQGQPFTYNVTNNDVFLPTAPHTIIPFGQPSCISLNDFGVLSLNPNGTDCCGDHQIKYRISNCQGSNMCEATVFVTIKCPKPNCFLVNLEDFFQSGSPAGTAPGCASACEQSIATYYVSYNPANTYAWTVVGGSYVAGGNPAEIMVTWGAAGGGSVAVTITNGNTSTTHQVCVDILTGPTASFQIADSSVCRDASVSFTNNSTGGSSFFWDFGDGNTSSMFDPTHQYTVPGTYTACLYVTKNNYDEHGNPLCCCTDSICLDIVVDSLAGPGIFCVSTLCAYDSSQYWTDATNCATYLWTVFDANGMPASFTGQGTDTISVQWGAGPTGTVTLEVAGCDSVYCDDPVTVVIPIISPTVALNGPVSVCENATATYTAPKWVSVDYDWQVTGGTIISGQGTNTVTIQWGVAPGPGMIVLNYGSPFLDGLPGHDPGDCGGSATLTVVIKPAFDIFGPSGQVCRFSSTTFSATASPWANYNWSISPSVPFSGQGSNVITVNWNGAPGFYTVSATPTNTMVYCNDTVSTVVQVTELPKPDSITGPVEICPGSSYAYFAHSSQSGVSFTWTVIGGTPASATGNPVLITWNATGPYKVILQQSQLGAPFCTSDTIQLIVLPKILHGPLTFNNPPACTNTLANYVAGPVQHPDATYTWKVVPASIGSVVSGQGTSSVQVQWNNTPGMAVLMLTVKLCNDSLSFMQMIQVNAPMVPMITQSGNLCPGGTAVLDAGPGFTSYLWSTMSVIQTTTISTGGTYIVTTTDVNNCRTVTSYQAQTSPGPVASISTGNPTMLYINPPNNNTVTINAQTNPNYTFAWYCNGTLQALPPTQAFFVHTNTNVAGSFVYQVVVTDGSNGCTNTSNPITVIQQDCSGGPGTTPCMPQPYTLSVASMNQMPNCSNVNFNVTASGNVTLNGWNFGDPNSNANTGTLTNAIHPYSKAGCFLTTLTGQVPEAAPGTGFCGVQVMESVCVPLVANFDSSVHCLTVNFHDLSTFLTGQGPTQWLWSFGDGNMSMMPPPLAHTYLMAGTYSVTLTVTNANGCQSTVVKPVVVAGPPAATIMVNPNPACVGQPVQFMATGGGISWLWNFADGTTNGAQNPAHTFLMPGGYVVTLTVTDAQGCTGTSTQLVTINPLPPADTISYTTPLTFCAGGNVILNAPTGPGYTWLWNTGATTQSITVMVAGTYSVIVRDANGCTFVPPPVTAIVLPLPVAQISGNPVICDSGCTTLSAPAGFTYVWVDNNNNPLVPAETNQNLLVCDTNLLPGYAVVVTDANGCQAYSPQVVVSIAVSPSFSLTTAPDSCAGTPATITLAPVQPNVVYAWSNGSTGPFINVIQAGTYVVVGTDTTSGCTATASATIHPLPNLCLVPVGCYEVCNPDTICGPDSLAAYQWNLNGTPLPGETGQCLIVTQSGTYTLTGTNEFGCDATSDSLMLVVKDCGCEELTVTAVPSTIDSCCWIISYSNGYGPLYGVVISTTDAEMEFNLSTLSPALQVYSIDNQSIGLVNSDPGEPLPEGALDSFLTICLNNVENVPQQIIFDWYGFDFNIACSDTLEFDCPVEPDCAYVKNDSIYCMDGEVTYTFTVCNPADNTFDVGYIVFQPHSPVGIQVVPSGIVDTLNPLVPGECRTYTVYLQGSNLADSIFCYSLTVHDAVPGLIDTTHCCMLDTTYCVPIPDCEPCDNLLVKEVIELPGSDDGHCCYQIKLYNGYTYNPTIFDGIQLCMLTPATSMTITNPFGSGWATTSYQSNMITLQAVLPLGTSIPLGTVMLPNICLNTQAAPPQMLEIKWLDGDSVLCRDTVPLSCEPPCGYIAEDTVICEAGSDWDYSGIIHNTSNFAMSQANIVFTSPAGLSSYNQTFILGNLPPGGSFPFNLPLGAPAQPGDTLCFTVALHQMNDDSMHVHCCNFYACIVLPLCPPDCHCDGAFQENALAGINCTNLPAPPPNAVKFSPGAIITSCDLVVWSWSNTTMVDTTYGNTSIIHSFPGIGNYQACMTVYRTDVDGQECKYKACKKLDFSSFVAPSAPDPLIYPNPSTGSFYVEWPALQTEATHLRIFDLCGRLIEHMQVQDAQNQKRSVVSLESAPPGIYLLEIQHAGKRWIKKIVMN